MSDTDFPLTKAHLDAAHQRGFDQAMKYIWFPTVVLLLGIIFS